MYIFVYIFWKPYTITVVPRAYPACVTVNKSEKKLWHGMPSVHRCFRREFFMHSMAGDCIIF